MSDKRLVVKIDEAGYGDKTVIRQFFFECRLPELVYITGSNGSGKSTLLRCLSGELPYKGSITLQDGQERIPHKHFLNKFYYLSQRNDVYYPIKVIELVIMGRHHIKKWYQPYNKADVAAALESLAFFNLHQRAYELYQELSGGQQQMVWVAQALCSGKSILLLDEPAQSLDYKNKLLLYSNLQNLVATQGIAVFCISHDLDMIKSHQGQILDIDD